MRQSTYATETRGTKKPRAHTKKQSRKPLIFLTSDLTTVFGYNTISQRSGTNKLRCWRAGTTAGLTNCSTTRVKHTTMAGDSYGPYTEGKFGMRPQSIGAIQRRRKNLLTQPWNPTSHLTLPFCPATKKRPHLVQRMSMSTIGFIAHALRPSIPKEYKK